MVQVINSNWGELNWVVDCSHWHITEENRPDMKLITLTRGAGWHVEMAASSATNSEPNRDCKFVFLNGWKKLQEAVWEHKLLGLKADFFSFFPLWC